MTPSVPSNAPLVFYVYLFVSGEQQVLEALGNYAFHVFYNVSNVDTLTSLRFLGPQIKT